jgi:ribosomal protein S18 acetylase RimI-like enzyme
MAFFQTLNNTNLDEVLQFMIACDISDFGEADSSREDLEEQWDEMDLAKDGWVARDTRGNIIGYAGVTGKNSRYGIDLYVNNPLSPEGLEDELMGKCLERANELAFQTPNTDTVHLIGYATSVNQRLQGVFEKNGFDRHTYHYRMQINFNGPVEPSLWPEEFTLSSYEEDDETELFQLIQSTFTWEGRTPISIDRWRNLVFRGGRYDPEFFVLVRTNGKLVGAALSYAEKTGGWIRQLAVAKDYQGKGLGSRLLLHMFSVFYKKGLPGIGLGVASLNSKAWHFYENVGMYRSREFIEYRKRIK